MFSKITVFYFGVLLICSLVDGEYRISRLHMSLLFLAVLSLLDESLVSFCLSS